MKQFEAAVFSILFAGGLAAGQDKKEQVHVDKDNGFTIQKPPKKDDNDAWAIRTDGKKLNNSLVSIQHRMDDLAVEVFFQKQNKQQPIDLDPKKTADQEIKGMEEAKTKGDYKEVKVKDGPKEGAFPGDGGPKCFYIKVLITDKNDKQLEWYEWIFVSKVNKGQYRLFVLCAAGEFEKKKKEIDLILRSFRSYDLPK